MLKPVIQQVDPDFGSQLFFRQQPGPIAAGADEHRAAQFARDQQRFIAELFRCAFGINSGGFRRLPSVSAREYIESDATRLEQLPKQHHEWRLARPADRQIADTDYGKPQPVWAQYMAIVKPVAK